MNWTLEVIVVPVSDLDRAKSFYADPLDNVGFVYSSDPCGNEWAVSNYQAGAKEARWAN